MERHQGRIRDCPAQFRDTKSYAFGSAYRSEKAEQIRIKAAVDPFWTR